MFTGIVTHTGTATLDAHRLRVSAPRDCANDLEPGASIAVDGACLTVTEIHSSGASGDSGSDLLFDISDETLACTTIGEWRDGRRVNLERAMRAGGEIGGHFVSGHIDAVCKVNDIESASGRMVFEMPIDCAPHICHKGSVCINGVSLTVSYADEKEFGVHLIPHTLEQTNLSDLNVGSAVNLEVDLLSRYLYRLLQMRDGA